MNNEVEQPEIEAGDQPDEAPGFWGRVRPLLREVLETVGLALLVWAGIAFFIPPYEVGGSSMEPTVVDGEQVIASRAAYWFSSPQRGDIIVLRSPEDLSTVLVKRVIGLPGEEVAVLNGTVYIDGVRLVEPYLESGVSFDDRVWTVPENTVFVMGDNRLPSRDSRTWGPVNKETIIGKAWIIYWPIRAWGGLPHYQFPDPLPVIEEDEEESEISETPVEVSLTVEPNPAAATEVGTVAELSPMAASEISPTSTRLPETDTPTPIEPVEGTIQVMTFMYSTNSFNSSIMARLHVNTEVQVMGRDAESGWLYCREPINAIDGWVWAGTVEMPVPVSTLSIVE
jgi:signal peptidase I